MRDETAEPSTGGLPKSQECHAPDLTSGNQECAGAPAREKPGGMDTIRPHTTKWPPRFAGQSLVLSWFAMVCVSFSLLRSLVPLAIGISTAERFSARPVPYLPAPYPPPLPRIIVNTTTRSDQTPRAQLVLRV